MADRPVALDLMLRKLTSRTSLTEADRKALLALPHRLRRLDPSAYVVREGDRSVESCLIVTGFAFRHKVTATGARQIIGVHIPGDFVDLEGALLNVCDHNIETLTRCEMAFVPRHAMRQLLADHPRVGMAMWVDTLIDASIFREWVVNIGRRDARERIAHLLCEFARRLEAVGLARSNRYELPMTQEQIADAVGLTAVHVNRVLQHMSRQGLIQRERRSLGIPDWDRLRNVAGFNERYLHLDQAAPALA